MPFPRTSEIRHWRAVLAGLGNGRYADDHPAVVAARASLKAAVEKAELKSCVDVVIKAWPRLPGDLRARVAVLVGGADPP